MCRLTLSRFKIYSIFKSLFSVYFYIDCYISLKSLFLEDFKYSKTIFFEYANFMVMPL